MSTHLHAQTDLHRHSTDTCLKEPDKISETENRFDISSHLTLVYKRTSLQRHSQKFCEWTSAWVC